jgi:nitrogen fixation protein NifU and related proteins
LPEATATVQVENPICGDIMQLSIKLDSASSGSIRNPEITDIRFRIRGCVTSIACASVLTEMLRGTHVADAKKIERQKIVDTLGGLSNETMHGSYLVMDALAALLTRLAQLELMSRSS